MKPLKKCILNNAAFTLISFDPFQQVILDNVITGYRRFHMIVKDKNSKRERQEGATGRLE